MTPVKTLHRWFRSREYSLLGHIDLPERRRETGVVIVPPFGWEEACSYRSLRFLARTLAEAGIPVMRYDLPGAGNSSGSLGDSGLVESWITSVGDAANELRAVSGVREITAAGISLGAMLAAFAACRGGEIQDLVLWGAASSGRAVIREMRAYAKMERWEYSTEPPFPFPPVPGFEVGGFVISPETQRDLEALDLCAVPVPGKRRVLMLSRDELRPDGKLLDVFRSSGCDVHLRDGAGYSAMMTAPHEAQPPYSTARIIADFVAESPENPAPEPVSAPYSAVISQSGSSVVESVVPFGESMFGVLTEPATGAPRTEHCALYLNAGAVRHTGPNRMWVEAARRNAARGIASLRFDIEGIGESGGGNIGVPELFRDICIEQVEQAMDVMRTRLGLRKFVAIGLCAGAFWGFHTAIRNRDVCGAVLLNPRLFFWDPEVDRRRLLRRGARGLKSPADWWRLLRGGVQWNDLKHAARIVLGRSSASRESFLSGRMIPPRKMASAWSGLRENETRLVLVFSEGEPLLREMEEEGQLPPPDNPRVQLIRLPKTGHTLRPQWAQKMVADLIDESLASAVAEASAQAGK